MWSRRRLEGCGGRATTRDGGDDCWGGFEAGWGEEEGWRGLDDGEQGGDDGELARLGREGRAEEGGRRPIYRRGDFVWKQVQAKLIFILRRPVGEKGRRLRRRWRRTTARLCVLRSGSALNEPLACSEFEAPNSSTWPSLKFKSSIQIQISFYFFYSIVLTKNPSVHFAR